MQDFGSTYLRLDNGAVLLQSEVLEKLVLEKRKVSKCTRDAGDEKEIDLRAAP